MKPLIIAGFVIAIVALSLQAGPVLFGGHGSLGLIIAAGLVFVVLPVAIVIAVRKPPTSPRE